jgi:hypothetical protein
MCINAEASFLRHDEHHALGTCAPTCVVGSGLDRSACVGDRHRRLRACIDGSGDIRLDELVLATRQCDHPQKRCQSTHTLKISPGLHSCTTILPAHGSALRPAITSYSAMRAGCKAFAPKCARPDLWALHHQRGVRSGNAIATLLLCFVEVLVGSLDKSVQLRFALALCESEACGD